MKLLRSLTLFAVLLAPVTALAATTLAAPCDCGPDCAGCPCCR